MAMSDFVRLSKEIGWVPPNPPLQIPTPDEARELASKAARDIDAFRMVFTIHRFCDSGVSHQDTEAINIIATAFEESRGYWQ